MNITSQDRLDLKKIMDNNTDYIDNTENIRNVKHSVLIHKNINILEKLKKEYTVLCKEQPDSFRNLASEKCQFLFNNYTDIFNKVLKDELDFDIMSRLLSILKEIEDGKIDQQDGSIMVGKILKELYIDSAVRSGDNIDKQYESDKITPVDGMCVSWKTWKTWKI